MTLAPLYETLRALRAELQATAGQSLPGQCAVFGSTVLALAGLREECGDVDLAVLPALYRALQSRPGWTEQTPNLAHPRLLSWSQAPLQVDAFQAWRDDEPAIDVAEMIREAAMNTQAGLPCIPLALVRTHKVASLGYFAQQHDASPYASPRQAKHVRDIAAIDARLTVGVTA